MSLEAIAKCFCEMTFFFPDEEMLKSPPPYAARMRLPTTVPRAYAAAESCNDMAEGI